MQERIASYLLHVMSLATPQLQGMATAFAERAARSQSSVGQDFHFLSNVAWVPPRRWQVLKACGHNLMADNVAHCLRQQK